MKILIDHEKCTALGICESLAPDHFEVDDEGNLQLLKETVSDDEIQAVEDACAGCPTEALRLER